MGILDSIKGLVRGKKPEIKDGIDKAAAVVDDKVGEEHDDKIAKAADMAKDAVDKLPE
jgi:hypothetical protein